MLTINYLKILSHQPASEWYLRDYRHKSLALKADVLFIFPFTESDITWLSDFLFLKVCCNEMLMAFREDAIIPMLVLLWSPF